MNLQTVSFDRAKWRRPGETTARRTMSRFIIATLPASHVALAGPAPATSSAVSRPIDKLCAALLDIVKLGKSAPFAKRFQAVAPAIDDAFDLATIL